MDAIKSLITAAMVGGLILSTTSKPKAMEPAEALVAIVRMETAQQFCNLPTPRDILLVLLKDVRPYVNMTDQQFVARVRHAANELGKAYNQIGTLYQFCSEMADTYAMAGRK